MKSKFQLVFGQLSVSSWVKKGHEPSWAENPSARARLGLITSRYVNQLVDIESLMSTVKSTDNTQTHVEITEEKSSFGVQKLKVLQPEFSSFISRITITNCWEIFQFSEKSKEIVEREHGEPIKFLFLSKMDLLGQCVYPFIFYRFFRLLGHTTC